MKFLTVGLQQDKDNTPRGRLLGQENKREGGVNKGNDRKERTGIWHVRVRGRPMQSMRAFASRKKATVASAAWALMTIAWRRC